MKFTKYLVLAVLLSGCTIAPLNKYVQHLTPPTLKDKPTKSISVTKVTNAVTIGQVIGKYYGGTWCLPHGELTWTPGTLVFSEYSNVVRNKLKENGYTLLGEANSPFNEELNKQSELLLGGKIIDLNFNACHSIMGTKGEIFIKVEWELFDNKSKKVITTITTEGISSASEFDSAGDLPLLKKAFAMAADNLLANKQFCDLLTIAKISHSGCTREIQVAPI